MMDSMKKPKRKVYPTKLERLNIKMTKSERAALDKKAKKFCKGNLSLWLRTSGLKYTPPVK